MDKKLNQLHRIYDEIKVPKEIDDVIGNAINKHRVENKRRIIKMSKSNIVKRASAIAATVIIGMGITVNVSPVLAQELSEMPIIGSVAKIMTFRDYNIDTDVTKGTVSIPKVELDNKGVEAKINEIIQAKVKVLEEEQEKLDAEYKQAFLETGGTEETFNKIETVIDYRLNYTSDKLISFVINKTQSLAKAYNESVYYNMDINTGESFTLEAVLGEDYATVVKTNVLDEMNKRMKADKDMTYDIEYLKKKIKIDNDRKFYINDKLEIVVVFDKYEVAAGVYGPQEFVVGNM